MVSLGEQRLTLVLPYLLCAARKFSCSSILDDSRCILGIMQSRRELGGGVHIHAGDREAESMRLVFSMAPHD